MRRPARWSTIGVLALLATAAPMPIAALPASAAVDAAPGRTYTVTLLTGDVVTAHLSPGRCPQATVRPAAPGRVTTVRCDPRGRLQVVPADVAPHLGHTLDPALFDVSGLIANGYDDARTAELPLIVRDAPGPESRQPRALRSLGAAAVRHPKRDSARFRNGLARGAKVWLDSRVRAASAPAPSGNLRQVHAPAAWRSGYTGQGVRVAVLDTGIDATHPDLRGRVAESADFTGDGDVADRNGHGTHVAATVAGTGAASAGRHRGVAPGAQLVIGKVLGADGTGSTSDTIAAMEWAATRAPIVNLSLGSLEPSDGTDPLSLAVNDITARHGTLFVTSAGNFGPAGASVTAPGAADAALTVGAVDPADTVRPDSGRGPTPSRPLKPEIVAPGLDIVSARADGTAVGRIIDAHYTAESGTSMAVPHVAGAAAILRQRHPGWPAAKLRSALIASADPASGDPAAAGAGRLHVARSLGDVVPADATPDPGPLSWTNTGATARRAGLSVEVVAQTGAPAPAGAVTLSAAAVTVPAGGTGGVTLRVDRRAFRDLPGRYLARVTARWGGHVTRTVAPFTVEGRTYPLTIRAAAIPATAEGASWATAAVVSLDDPLLPPHYVEVSPLATVRVPAGRYSVLGEIHDSGSELPRIAVAGNPDVTVTSATEVLLDGTRAVPVGATVTGVETVQRAAAVIYEQTPRAGQQWWSGVFTGMDPLQPESQLFVVPGAGTAAGKFAAYQFFTLDQPGDRPAYRYDLVRPLGPGLGGDPHYVVDRPEQARLARITQRFGRLGGATEHRRYGQLPGGTTAVGSTAADLPPARTDYLTPDLAWWEEVSFTGALGEDPMTVQDQLRRYGPGSARDATWLREPLHTDWYAESEHRPSWCLPEPIRRTPGNLRVAVTDLVDVHGRFDCFSRHPVWADSVRRRLTLHRDGAEVGSVTTNRADFAIPAEPSTYRLTYDLSTAGVLPFSTHVSTAWTFRSAGSQSTDDRPVALLSADYTLPGPGGGEAAVAVRQMPGTPEQHITRMAVWTSADDGATWTAARIRADGPGRAIFDWPVTGVVSLRVSATGAGGSAIEQTIIRAAAGKTD